jgi:N,N'-diacetyllegionaminate synthase
MKFSQSLTIGDRQIGPDHPCFVIAEAGVAHLGNFEKAIALVDLAVRSRADAVKFQIFDVDAMFSDEAGEWRERMGDRCLSFSQFSELQHYCQQSGIIFFATAHDQKSFEFLGTLGVPLLKIGSGELWNWPFITLIAQQQKPTILSTGMADLEDVRAAVALFRKAQNPHLALLHCVTSYPTPPEDVNLRAINLLRREFETVTGYSDHTEGYHVPLAAVALGATIIEKHIAMDFGLEEAQDWKVSCGPSNLDLFIRQIRDIEAANGQEKKEPNETEIKNRTWARKSLVALRDLKSAQVLSREDLGAKRPGTGIPASELDNVVGRRLNMALEKNSVIRWDCLE